MHGVTAAAFAAWLGATGPARAASGPVFEDASARLGPVSIVSFPNQGSGYCGVGLLDADADGDLELYFGNGPGMNNVLLRNDGAGQFVDVAVETGAAVGTGSTGILAADLDNDGYPELVLAGDRSALRTLGNRGDGTFVDVTGPSGLIGSRRNTSAHAADIDNDGDLDVYVTGGIVPETNYLNTLWRNNGDRTFTEIGAAAGVGTNVGACSASFTHLDDDAAIDLVVANCNDISLLPTPFEVYRNSGDGTFASIYETAKIWEIDHFMAFAMTDFDGDLRLDFFSTNVGTVGRDGPHALYRNNGDGTWSDVAPQAGVSDHPFGWGAVAADVDNDGWEDLYYVGMSHAQDMAHSPGLLFMNRGDGTYAPPIVPRELGVSFASGLATGDVDGDGWMDFVVAVSQSMDGALPGAPVLLLNRTGDTSPNHWLSVRATGSWDNRGAIGAVVYATAAGPAGAPRTQMRELAAGTSFMSTNSPWPHFGLGAATEADLCVRWPDGSEEGYGVFPAGQRVDVAQGQGAPATCATPGASDPGDPSVPPPATEPRCGCATRDAAGGALGAWVWSAAAAGAAWSRGRSQGRSRGRSR